MTNHDTRDPSYYRDKITEIEDFHISEKQLTKDPRFRRIFVGIPENMSLDEDAGDQADLQKVALFVLDAWNSYALRTGLDPTVPTKIIEMNKAMGSNFDVDSPRVKSLIYGYHLSPLRFQIGGEPPHGLAPGSEGGYFPGENIIWISNESPDQMEVMVHELQHAMDEVSSEGRNVDPSIQMMAMAQAKGDHDEAFRIYNALSHEVSARISQLLLDIMRKDQNAEDLKKELPDMLKQHDLTDEVLGGSNRRKRIIGRAVSYWIRLQELKKDPSSFVNRATRGAKEVAKITAREILPGPAVSESIEPDQIDAISRMKDISSAKDVALALAFSNARSPERRADLRDQIRSAGTVTQLIKILWSMKLSNDGLKTGMGTVKTRKGIGYSR